MILLLCCSVCAMFQLLLLLLLLRACNVSAAMLLRACNVSVALLLRERYLLLGGECCFLLNVAVNNVNATMRNNRKRNDEKGKFGDI